MSFLNAYQARAKGKHQAVDRQTAEHPQIRHAETPGRDSWKANKGGDVINTRACQHPIEIHWGS